MTECMSSSLDLFAPSSVQMSILKTDEISYLPISSLDNASSIEFLSLGHSEVYRDLSSVYIKLKVQAQESELKKYTVGGPGVVNNLLHSLFEQCNVFLNGKLISSDQNYHYRSYIENLTNYGTDAASTHLETVGWVVDTGKVDSLTTAENPGLDTRKSKYENGVVVELYGRLHCDFFSQNRLLLNNIDLKVVLTLSRPSFYLLEEETKTSTIKIMEATLFMNHVTLNPSILLSHETILTKTPALYPYKRNEVKAYTIPAGTQTLSLDSVVIGQLPNMIIFGMVDNDSYTGKRSKNPFNFQHYKISQFNLSVNGVQVPRQPIEFDYTGEKPISSRGYNTLFKGTGIHYFDRGHQITKKRFDSEGMFLLACDLTADQQNTSSCDNLRNSGTLRIEGRFAAALTKTITCICYMEFDAVAQIDKNRNIFVN